MLLVLLAFYHETALQLCRYLDVVVTIDAEYVFHHVARTLNVNPVSRNVDVDAAFVLSGYFHLKRLADALDGFRGDVLAYEGVHIVVVKPYLGVLNRVGIFIAYLHRHLSSCQLLAKDGCLLKGIDGAVGVDAALEAEGGVGAQAVAARALPDPCRVEIGALKHDVGGCLVCAAALSSEHSRYTHRLLDVADAQVVGAERVLHTVKSDEFCALWLRAHHNLVAFHHVGVKTVHRLSVGHHYIISNVNNVVDRTKTYHPQLVLKPFRALLHLAARNADTGVAATGLSVLYHHIHRQVVVVNTEL